MEGNQLSEFSSLATYCVTLGNRFHFSLGLEGNYNKQYLVFEAVRRF